MNMFQSAWKLVPNKIRGKGGREIDKLRGVSPAVDTTSGSEAWIGSVTRVGNPPADNPNYGCAQVVLPDGRQMYLFEAIALAPSEVLGEKHMQKSGTGLGMLVKYLDAQAQYGLQCHPTRAWAKEMFNSDYGKEESWYVIGLRDDVENPPYIYLGFKDGVTRADFEKYYFLDDIEALENLCHRIEVQMGDAYFVGGGVPHALGEGCFVIEVQEPSDITLGAHTQGWTHRNRPGYRPPMDDALFNARLLGAYIYDGCTPEENLNRWQVAPTTIRSGAWGKEDIIIGPQQTSFFSFTRVDVTAETAVRQTGFPQIGIVLEGQGTLTFEGGSLPLQTGDEFFLPYNVSGACFVPNGNLAVILCHPEGVEY